MSRYAVGRDGQIFCTDFLVFIYLDSVTPGEGGLCLVHGSRVFLLLLLVPRQRLRCLEKSKLESLKCRCVGATFLTPA